MKALQKLADLDQQISKARQREIYRRLIAPVTGTVQAVKVHTPGAVVTSADTLMTLVPDGSGVEVEAMAENKDIGFLREGQEVAIKLEAFPFTRYGMIKGVLSKLGRDAATAQQVAASVGVDAPRDPTGRESSSPTSTMAFPARIALAQDWILADGVPVPIRAGMRVSAEIRTGSRRAIDYVLSPVLQAVSEAGRER